MNLPELPDLSLTQPDESWNEGYAKGRADALEECKNICQTIEQSKPLTDKLGWEHGTMDCLMHISALKDSKLTA
jgi:hypothetical protein